MSKEDKEKNLENKAKKAKCDSSIAQPKISNSVGGGETKNIINVEPDMDMIIEEVQNDDDIEEKIDKVGDNPFVDGAGGGFDE